jgi:thiol-disulfide isomerase/thioredoxin
VALHSPTEAAEEPANNYIDGWRGISRLMESGASWSGHERNCAFLNVGDRRFVDISTIAGLDHIQDGRAMAQSDWDGDGDLDLWLKSRNGQQLRLLESQQDGKRPFVALRLRGTSCNRDAIGARVELTANGKTYVQEVRAGEGYLAQSSTELLFGWPEEAEVEGVTVYWPGGKSESFEGVLRGRHHRLIQGEGRARPLAARERSLPAPSVLPTLPASKRVVLRTPLPLPTATQRRFFDSSRQSARLINLWATWCAPCVQELGDLAQRNADLSAAQIEVVPLCLDAEENPELARQMFEQNAGAHMSEETAFTSRDMNSQDQAFFEVLFNHLMAKGEAMPVPTSFLVDQYGRVVVVYLGPVDVDRLLADTATFGIEPEINAVRASFPGRWFFGMPRDWAGLSRAFLERGLTVSSKFYAALDRRSPAGSK